MSNTPRVLFAVSALILSFSCGGGSDNNPINPKSIDPSGEWAITYTITSDTCNSGFVNETLDVELTLSNDGNFVYWQDEGEPCGAFPLPWNGTGNESFTDTEDFMGGDGCSYHDDITGLPEALPDLPTRQLMFPLFLSQPQTIFSDQEA